MVQRGSRWEESEGISQRPVRGQQNKNQPIQLCRSRAVVERSPLLLHGGRNGSERVPDASYERRACSGRVPG
eukprot:gene19376-biopygen2498